MPARRSRPAWRGCAGVGIERTATVGISRVEASRLAPALAGGRQAAAVLLDDRAADRQAQAQPAEPARRSARRPARTTSKIRGSTSGSMPMP